MIALCYKLDEQSQTRTFHTGEAVLSFAQSNYKSYMLRLWRIKDSNRYTWRASLENVESGELIGFVTLEKLIEFLQSLGDELEVEDGKGENGG